MWTLGLLSIACTPGIVIAGDEPLREAAIAAIRTASISIDGADRGVCGSLQVELDRTGDRIAVAIEDSSGRRIERSVGSVEMIAALIDAWTTVPAELMDVPEEPIETPPLDKFEITAAKRIAPAAHARSMFLLSFSAEAGVGDDASIVAGPSLGACLRLGSFCIDFTARFLYGRTVGRREALHAFRSELEAALGARMELKAGPIAIAPGLSTGVAWLRSSVVEQEDAPIACPRSDPCLIGAGRPVGAVDMTRLRAHAGVSFFIPLDDVFQIEVLAGASFSPFSRDISGSTFEGKLVPQGLLIDEPKWSGRLAVGFRIGL